MEALAARDTAEATAASAARDAAAAAARASAAEGERGELTTKLAQTEAALGATQA